MKRLSTALKAAVSIAILLLLFRKADLTQGVQYLSQLNYSFVLLSLVLIVSGQIARAHRLAVMVLGRSAGKNLWRMLSVQMVSFLPGVISPAKVGEAAKIYMLQKQFDVPVPRGLVCFVGERVLDLLLLGPLAALGLAVLFGSDLAIDLRLTWAYAIILVILAGAAALAGGFVWARRRGTSVRDLWQTVSPQRIIEAGALTLVYWTVVFLEVWCFCRASPFDARIWHVALVVPVALLSSMIPISLSGFGLREAAFILLLQRPPIGMDYERALLVSLMYIVVGLGIPALMGVLFWLGGKERAAS